MSKTVDQRFPEAAKPAVQAKLLAAARGLAADHPVSAITLSMVARKAKVSWPTARRYLGSKQNLHAFLQSEELDTVAPKPVSRELILDAAARVFGRRGYERATLDEVGAEAGMTKGAVYWHYGTKADLFLALVDERAGVHLSLAGDSLESALSAEDAPGALSLLLEKHLLGIKQDGDSARLFVEFLAEARAERLREPVVAAYARSRTKAAAATRSAQKSGRVSEKADPESFAILWAAIVEGLSLLALADPGRVDPSRLAPQVVDVIWNGMKRRYGGH